MVYPQITGKLRIPSVTFTGVIRPTLDDFDPFAFMNDGGDIPRQLQAEGLTIDVVPLPQKPANFSGAVGKLSMTAQLSKSNIKEGRPHKPTCCNSRNRQFETYATTYCEVS